MNAFKSLMGVSACQLAQLLLLVGSDEKGFIGKGSSASSSSSMALFRLILLRGDEVQGSREFGN